MVGNPNAGKSTIFNKLTKSNIHTGNFSGVTVDATTKKVTHNFDKYSITDLPGIYGLTPSSQDEKNAVEAIERNQDALFVNVVDVNTLAKSLNLTIQLINRGLRVIVLLNFLNTAKKRKMTVDFDKLSTFLGVKVIALDCKAKDFTQEFYTAVARPYGRSQIKCNTSTYIDRQNYIDKILRNVILTPPKDIYGYSRLDKILLNKYLGLPIFFAIMLFIFWLTFGVVGDCLSGLFGTFFDILGGFFTKILTNCRAPEWVISFVEQAIIGGIGGVITFLPQILLLWFCLEFLEQSGYISRLVYLVEPWCKKLGLSGRSIFSLLLGFGCTTLAVPTVATINSPVAKIKTALLLPFMNCNAKLPVLGCIAGALFFTHKVLAIFALYLLGVVVAILVAMLLQVFYPTPRQSEIVEFCQMRLPSFGSLCQKSLATALAFLRKIWGLILCFSILIWFLNSFTINLLPAESSDQSILATLSKLLAPIFYPLGFDWGAVVALVVGVVAKEMVLSTIAVLNASSLDASSLLDSASVVHFDLLSGVAFLVFCTLYTPCISAIAQLRHVLPTKIFYLFIIMQLVIAYFVSFLARLFVSAVSTGGVSAILWVTVVSVVTISLFIYGLRRIFLSKRCRNCKFCNRH